MFPHDWPPYLLKRDAITANFSYQNQNKTAFTFYRSTHSHNCSLRVMLLRVVQHSELLAEVTFGLHSNYLRYQKLKYY